MIKLHRKESPIVDEGVDFIVIRDKDGKVILDTKKGVGGKVTAKKLKKKGKPND